MKINNWPLLIDPEGYIAEGTGNNFFMIKDNVIYTPEGRNILRGTRRDYIFELAEQLNIECLERNLEPYDIYHADEAFVTGTPFCLLPVSSFQFKPIGDAKFGPLTKKIMTKWSENVGLDIMKQIIEFNKNHSKEIEGSSPYQHKPEKISSNK